MDTCGLERVERFRINLNEKNFASQNNTLTSSLERYPSEGTSKLTVYREAQRASYPDLTSLS